MAHRRRRAALRCTTDVATRSSVSRPLTAAAPPISLPCPLLMIATFQASGRTRARQASLLQCVASAVSATRVSYCFIHLSVFRFVRACVTRVTCCALPSLLRGACAATASPRPVPCWRAAASLLIALAPSRKHMHAHALVTLLAAAVSVAPAAMAVLRADGPVEPLFAAFKQKYGRSYGTAAERRSACAYSRTTCAGRG
ncbi:hypothetical protein ERJ75_000309600 [Trypanosoma vivax]|nr:hypothetical protein ERJ75_000309600 [Trypanosoma vivax]